MNIFVFEECAPFSPPMGLLYTFMCFYRSGPFGPGPECRRQNEPTEINRRFGTVPQLTPLTFTQGGRVPLSISCRNKFVLETNIF